MKKMLITMGLAVAATLLFVGPAGAAVTYAPNPIPVTASQTTAHITVNFTNADPLKRTFLVICKKIPNDPTFNWASDCSGGSELTFNPDQTGSGTYEMDVFHGTEPSGDVNWGCFAPGETPPAGIEAPQCYLRFTTDAEVNNGAAQFVPITFTLQGAPVPESPLVILLPILAGVVLVGAFVMQRRRSTGPSEPQIPSALT